MILRHPLARLATATCRRPPPITRSFHTSRTFLLDRQAEATAADAREILDDFAAVRTVYRAPQHPIVLAHGLLGFSKIHLAGPLLPPVEYWAGISAALQRLSPHLRVVACTVPPTGSIAQRARALATDIRAHGLGATPVNIIAHSMGGLDARYLAAHLAPDSRTPDAHHATTPHVRVAALVTVATPHRGSAVADAFFAPAVASQALTPAQRWGAWAVAGLGALGCGTGAFAQLTRGYMAERFNVSTVNSAATRYFSYGARMPARTSVLNPFAATRDLIARVEGANDGLVSVASSRWGEYKGTLVDVSHMDLINWSNRVAWRVRAMRGEKQNFNAVAFYLHIADMLAKEGL